MKNIDELRVKFILTFFEPNDHPSSEYIAKTLIENGECLVAGDKCIWSGGISEFIKTKPADNTGNCLLYEFDLKNFEKSKFFKDTLENNKKFILYRIKNLEKQIEDLKKE